MATRTITSRAIVFPAIGNPHDILSLHSYYLPDTVRPGSVLVKFLAAPINPADLNQIEGVYPSKAIFQPLPGKDGLWAVGGNEGAVKIIGVGDNVNEPDIEVGRLAIMKFTAFGSICTVLHVNNKGLGGHTRKQPLIRCSLYLRTPRSRQFLPRQYQSIRLLQIACCWIL